ncbi:ester cyclase [Psychroserpens mesophilus]|uniref:ester cyclase n=1 Tax=Psychroserpens mesophilus TaxID=325473 RepID=UPI003D64D343
MKSIKLLSITLIITLSVFYVQGQNIEKDIKMYTQVWDDIVNKGDINKINSTYFDTNITAVHSPENIVGIENFKAYYQNFITGFSNIEFTIIDVFGQNDKIVKHWNFKGTHTGDFFGIPATNKIVDVEGVTLTKMKNGKIAQEQDFMDNAVFMQQLGLTSNPENISIINGLYDAFAKGDIPTVLSGMDAAVVWNEAESNSLADGNPYLGPAAILNGVFARLGANHEYFKLADIELHEMSNNQVLATLRYDAKNKATGIAYNAQAAHLWTLNGGKVIAFQQYVDTKKLADSEK